MKFNFEYKYIENENHLIEHDYKRIRDSLDLLYKNLTII